MTKTHGVPDSKKLNEMIEEAIVDCYNESEMACGIFTMMEENLKLPFQTTVLGVQVTVESLDQTSSDRIVAICRKGEKRQRISILDLPIRILRRTEPTGLRRIGYGWMGNRG